MRESLGITRPRGAMKVKVGGVKTAMKGRCAGAVSAPRRILEAFRESHRAIIETH